jgi:hypothetical protein
LADACAIPSAKAAQLAAIISFDFISEWPP